MKAASMPSVFEVETDSSLRNFTVSIIANWQKLVEGFREWERKELIEKDPSTEDVERHRKEAAFIIRNTHWLLSLVSDPESPAKECAREILGRLRQLEETFEMIHNPMPDAEADALIQKYFSNEPRSGVID
jgi:hypothetical protein